MANGFEQIEHIIVLMLENRSFDHMLGLLHRENQGGVDRRADSLLLPIQVGNEESKEESVETFGSN